MVCCAGGRLDWPDLGGLLPGGAAHRLLLAAAGGQSLAGRTGRGRSRYNASQMFQSGPGTASYVDLPVWSRYCKLCRYSSLVQVLQAISSSLVQVLQAM